MHYLLHCPIPGDLSDTQHERGLPFSTYTPGGGGGGGEFKSPLHFYCILHAKMEEGIQIACKIVYVLNGRPRSMKPV